MPSMSEQASRRVGNLLLVPALVLLAVSSVVGGYVWSLGSFVDDNLSRMSGVFPPAAIRMPPATPDAEGRTPLNILFLGSEYIPDDPVMPGYSSDTMMLVHVNAARTRVDIITVPGDAMIRIPGVGRDRASSATTRGGVPLAVRSVESLLSVRVDHVVVMDLNGVAAMTDAVGGVEVDVPRRFTASGRVFEPGRQYLDGPAALAFVREQRHLPGRQLDRISNQSIFLHALAERVVSRGTLSDPAELLAFLEAVTASTAVDDGLTVSQMRDLAVDLRGLRADDAHVVTVPVAAVSTDLSAPTVVRLDGSRLPALVAALQADDLAGYNP